MWHRSLQRYSKAICFHMIAWTGYTTKAHSVRQFASLPIMKIKLSDIWLAKKRKGRLYRQIKSSFHFVPPPIASKQSSGVHQEERNDGVDVKWPLSQTYSQAESSALKIQILPLWFFAIVSYCAEEKPASLFGSSALFGYIGSRRPKGLTLKLPDFLKPSPLHIILITERR